MTTKTRVLTLLLLLSLFILLYALLLQYTDVKKIVWLAGRNINMQKKIKPVRISYIIPPDVVVNASSSSSRSSNELLSTFEKVMSSPDLTLHPNHDAYIPLLIDVYNDRSIKCRGSHYDIIAKTRTRSYIELLLRGVKDYYDNDETSTAINTNSRNSLPVILVDSDSSGCDNLLNTPLFAVP